MSEQVIPAMITPPVDDPVTVPVEEATNAEKQLVATAVVKVFSTYFSIFYWGGDVDVDEPYSQGGVSGQVVLDGYINPSSFAGSINVNADLSYEGHDIDITGLLYVADSQPDCSDLEIFIDGKTVSGEELNQLVSRYF